MNDFDTRSKSIEDENFRERKELENIHKKNGLIFLFTIACTTGAAFIFKDTMATPYVNITIFYVLGICVVARYTEGYIWGVMFAICSVLNVNFFFTYPFYSFNLEIEGYPVTFVIMCMIYIVISSMTTDMKNQAKILVRQETELMEAQKEKMRANLLRAVSHDLRTPLTGIIGNSRVCLDMSDELSVQEKRDLIKNIEEDATWLLNMVENLLTVTMIDADTTHVKKSFESVDELISSSVVRFKKRFPAAELKVFPPKESVMIMMDVTLIEQVIINLLQNAAIHSHTAKPIELSAYETEDKLWISVRDYGVGIEQKKLPHIFDGTGYDSGEEDRSDAHKGMGIGLSICKTIVVSHGGDIMAMNHEEGSEFRLYLPKEKEE